MVCLRALHPRGSGGAFWDGWTGGSIPRPQWGFGAPISGVVDTRSLRWRVFDRSWCICSFYAPHVGLPVGIRVTFWREFVHRATHIHSSLGLPMVIPGDANVWHPHFRLRTRSCDAMILSFMDLLISSCHLELCNPSGQATHISGGGLDCVFISRSCAVPITVHSGNQCCVEAPACCPLLGSDHFLCVAHSIPLPVSPARCEHRPLHPLRDWKPTLLRAHQDVLQWSSRLDAMISGPLPRESDRTSPFFARMPLHSARILAADSLHGGPPECFEACIARNGA